MGLFNAKMKNKVLEFFILMLREGVRPNQATLTSVLRVCTRLALLELGTQVRVHVLKYDQDLILNYALLDMYSKCGSLEDAKSIFYKMVEKDVISWSTMIARLAQNRYSRKALKLFELMKASGLEPNYITILSVLFACSHAGLVEDGLYYFQSMKKLYGIEPENEHYGCIIDLLGKAGTVDQVVKLIHDMEYEPDAVTWRALPGAYKVHRNTDLAIYAPKQILNLDPQDAGTYILLSNIYAYLQRWDNAVEVMKTMRDRGVRKEPGCSWIEVNKHIHAFIFRDRSHPKIVENYKELNQLIYKLLAVGYVPNTNFVLHDLEGEQKEDSIRYHSEKLAIIIGLMSLSRGKTIRIRKNIRICGDCHIVAKLTAKIEDQTVVIRNPIRYHHFQDGIFSCGDFW
ncbi:hypothetical protein Pint_33777 [Pistacia integerrima]|uniref:Uncharacterized protein n=1 Tax=Pistacia integerrima TaxID=434235 RepID=A0ACC0X6E0_9ROSI|nr:hypothetical protein Pint_33777 [Pistacia integerrima]